MKKLHRIKVGDAAFHARSGQKLLDAALVAGVELPHDCRAGRCGSCLARVRHGTTLGGEARQPGMVYACQAMVFSDLDIEVEPLPPVARTKAVVRQVSEVGAGIVELTLEPRRPLAMLPGQYCRFRFNGFPARPFSPTASMAGFKHDGFIRLHVKKVRDGRVTPHLGSRIGVGHALTIEGPFGHAFLRPGQSSRLVLLGSGTGFAPIWAVAAAALKENPGRRMVILATSRNAQSFYMGPALETACRFANVSIVTLVEDLPRALPPLVAGRALDHLPVLGVDDVVYAAGAPTLVDAVGDRAVAAGAMFYADPFEPAGSGGPGWLESARAWLGAA